MGIEYKNNLGPRSREPWAFMVGPGDQVEAFRGESIPGKCVVTSALPCGGGKWAGMQYQLEVAQGVRFLSGRMGFDTNRFTEAISAKNWAEVANALGLSVPVAQEFLASAYPAEAEKLNQIERELEALEETFNETVSVEELTVSFGSPTRRARSEGFWNWPVVVRQGSVVVATLTPDGEQGYSACTIEPSNAPVRVLEVTRTSGMGGGHVSIRLAVPEGAKARHQG